MEKMKKIVVVPKGAHTVESENGHAFLAGILLKVTVWIMQLLIKVMGEPAAVYAVGSLTFTETNAKLDAAETEEPVREVSEDVFIDSGMSQQEKIEKYRHEKQAAESDTNPDLPEETEYEKKVAEVEAANEAENSPIYIEEKNTESEGKTVKTPVKPAFKSNKKTSKKVLHPTMPGTGAAL